MSGGAIPAAEGDDRPATPLAQYMAYCRTALYCLFYIVFSGGLIRFNKMMMNKHHFPHSLALSACHMFVCSAFCSILYCVFPSWFPGMENTKGHRLELMKWFVPIGVCFAIMLFGSNSAYMYCSVTFLQFMKEANVALVFIISCVIGLQTCTRLKSLVIAWVIVGFVLSISGEVHFKWIGFVLQGISQLAEVSRMIMGEIVLSGKKLDPLSYNLFLAPTCLLVLIIANAIHWSPGTWTDFCEWWPLILANACVAFGLNIVIAGVIKECSAVGFVLTGLLKDIALVLFSAFVAGETVTPKQAWAFLAVVLGLLFWSWMKIYPSSKIVRVMETMLCSSGASEGEKKALLPKDQPSVLEKRV